MIDLNLYVELKDKWFQLITNNTLNVHSAIDDVTHSLSTTT